jgi:4,5-dihydroxyphthalate decarboxylase
MTIHLRAAFMPNPRVAPLLDGTVQPRGVELTWTTGDAGDLHEHHLRHGDFDVFEFSISNYLVTRDRPRELWDWVMIPVYASKATLGINTWVNVDAGIETGADLRGKRFGIPDYTMTAGLWMRAQMASLWGIAPQDLEWVVGRQGDQSHARQLGFGEEPPVGVTLSWSDPAGLDRRLQAGDIHAAFPALDVPLDTESGRLRRLFPDRGRAFFGDFHAKVGFLPVNHVVLVRRSLVETHPWLPEALLEAFESAKQEAYRRDRSAAGVFRGGNDDMDKQVELFGDDPFPYGLTANKAMLDMAAGQSHLDGLTRQVWDLSSFVADSVRDS